MRRQSKKAAPPKTIDTLKSLVRLGLPAFSDEAITDDRAAHRLKLSLAETLRALDGPMRNPRLAGVSPEDTLTYKTLRAEIEFGLGTGDTTAASELEAYLTGLDDLPGQLLRFARGGRFVGSGGVSSRQAIWGLMGVAFYLSFARGDVIEARHQLERIRRLIDAILPQPSGLGTRARCHEFLGQVYRTEGSFAEAQEHFVEAQRFIEARLRRELSFHRSDYQERRDAYHFSVIGTARILGGLGRLAMLQGQLRRAQSMLRASRTLLRPTGQAELKLVVESHLAITERRLSDPDVRDDSLWKKSIRRLERLWHAFESVQAPKPQSRGRAPQVVQVRPDVHGMGRCGFELVRAHLEHAEECAASSRHTPLAAAKESLDRLARLPSGHRPDVQPTCGDQYRHCTLEAWWNALQGAHGKAADLIGRAHDLEKSADHVDLDIVGSDSVDASLIELIAEDGFASLDLPAARAKFRALRRRAAQRGDRPLHAEAGLRWAIAEAGAGHLDRARALLDEWRAIAPFIDSAALHRLRRSANDRVDLHRFASLDVLRMEEKFFEEAMARHAGNRAAAMRAMHVSRTRFEKIEKRLREQTDTPATR